MSFEAHAAVSRTISASRSWTVYAERSKEPAARGNSTAGEPNRSSSRSSSAWASSACPDSKRGRNGKTSSVLMLCHSDIACPSKLRSWSEAEAAPGRLARPAQKPPGKSHQVTSRESTLLDSTRVPGAPPLFRAWNCFLNLALRNAGTLAHFSVMLQGSSLMGSHGNARQT